MKVRFENKLVYTEYQSIVDYLIALLENNIPDRIDNIILHVSIEFCDQYNYDITTTQNERKICPYLNLVVHIAMMGFLNHKPISRNLHKRFLFDTVNPYNNNQNITMFYNVMKLLTLTIKFAKTGELDINEETGETNDFF